MGNEAEVLQERGWTSKRNTNNSRVKSYHARILWESEEVNLKLWGVVSVNSSYFGFWRIVCVIPEQLNAAIDSGLGTFATEQRRGTGPKTRPSLLELAETCEDRFQRFKDDYAQRLLNMESEIYYR